MKHIIRITRESAFANRLRAYNVVLNGEAVGSIKNGATIEVPVSAESNELFLKIDWCHSNTVQFDSDANPIHFECGSKFTGLQLFKGVGHLLGNNSDYLWLNKVADD